MDLTSGASKGALVIRNVAMCEGLLNCEVDVKNENIHTCFGVLRSYAEAACYHHATLFQCIKFAMGSTKTN